MAKRLFHASLEGAQHGGKDLLTLIRFGKASGCKGVQPSNFHVTKSDGSLMKPKDVVGMFEGEGMMLDGFSAHCPWWVAGTAWTGSKTVLPFTPPGVDRSTPAKIEEGTVDYIRRFNDFSAECNNHLQQMFFGTYWGWEVATGYPWGLWRAPDGSYDLIQEGDARCRTKLLPLVEHAEGAEQYLGHEIHRGTAAMCADDFLDLRELLDNNKAVCVNADGSHCWENEDFETRFRKVGPHVTGAHVKDMVIIPGMNLSCRKREWKDRPMQFTYLGRGGLNLDRYAKLMYEIGYAERFCSIQGTDTAPLVGEAEDAEWDLDFVAYDAGRFISTELCNPMAEGSFEDQMGDQS